MTFLLTLALCLHSCLHEDLHSTLFLVIEFGEEVTIIDNTLLDHLLRNHLCIHMSQERLLLFHEIFHRLGIETLTGAKGLELIIKTGMKHRETILSELLIQHIKIRNRAHSRENSVVGEGMMLRTKGRNTSDALAASISTQGLVLDVATLKNDGTALSRTADFHDLARAGAERCFAAGHGGAVA